MSELPEVCTRCTSALAPEDLRCPVCGLPTPEPDPDDRPDPVTILRCHGCGAAVSYDPQAQAPRCDFCRSVMEVETPDDPVEQASHYVRFEIDDVQARRALRSWLGGLGFFRPSDLRDKAAIDSLRPLWWAGWMFDADVVMHWAADSDAGARRSAWAPHSGGSTLTLRGVVVPASRGLTQAECQSLIPHYRLRSIASVPEGNPKAQVEQFDLQRSAARTVIARGLEAVAAEHAANMIPGSTHRNLHVSVLPTSLHTTHYAFPAYVLAFRYGDRLYRAIVHGQDARVVVGKAPWSWTKILGTIATVIFVAAVVYLAIVAIN